MNTADPIALAKLEEKLVAEIAALERKRADLDAVRRVVALLSDPQGVAVLEVKTTTGATNGAAVAPQQETEVSPQSGEVNDAVIAVVRSMEGLFTIRDIDRTLISQGRCYVRSSVRAAVARMEARGEIAIDRMGQGRRPTQYKPLEP